MTPKQYRESISILWHWGRVKHDDLREHEPGMSQPATSQQYRAPNQESDADIFIPDEVLFLRADEAVNRVTDGYRNVLLLVFRDQLTKAFPAEVMREAVRRFWGAMG